jgi:hypothetical protein
VKMIWAVLPGRRERLGRRQYKQAGEKKQNKENDPLRGRLSVAASLLGAESSRRRGKFSGK